MIVAGKGGVGKSTVAAALAAMASDAGLRTLIVDVEGTAAVTALFGRPGALGYAPTTLRDATDDSAEIVARTLTSDDALLEYLDDHGLRRVSKRMAATGTLDLVATAIPGIKDILVLGKIKQLEQAASAGEAGAFDFIVVDAPAAGHAVTFLATASGMLDAIGVGPIRTQANDVLQMINDPARCQVLLVTLPEETPVNEAIETAFHLEDRAGVLLGPIVVNGVYRHLDLPGDARAAAVAAGVSLDDARADALEAAADFRRHRQALQDAQIARLADGLPLPQLTLPYEWSTDLGPAEMAELTAALTAAVRDLPDQAAGNQAAGNHAPDDAAPADAAPADASPAAAATEPGGAAADAPAKRRRAGRSAS
jgi:Mrp family chromosome partitioning ATPase